MVRGDFGLFPATDEDMEKLLKMKKNSVVEVSVKTLRNYKFLRKYFAMINTAWEFLNERQQEFFHNSKDEFRETLQISAGYYRPIWSQKEQNFQHVPISISFESMDEPTFDKLYNDVADVIFQLIPTNVNREEFNQALKDF